MIFFGAAAAVASKLNGLCLKRSSPRQAFLNRDSWLSVISPAGGDK
jgi:hypothetical protein